MLSIAEKVPAMAEKDFEALLVADPINLETAIATWRVTYHRRHNGTYKSKTGSEILDEYKILESAAGPELVIGKQ